MDIGIRLETASFEILSGLLESGELSSQDLTRAYLERIEALNRQVNAVIEINPDAMAIAETLDGERARGETRGLLHGLPILIKDNIDTADKMTTTAGSLALEGSIAPADAFVVQRLRAAGAVLLGKSNLSEWANIRSTSSTTGWSSRGGQTRNPYSLNHSPGGSSSGSGGGGKSRLLRSRSGDRDRWLGSHPFGDECIGWNQTFVGACEPQRHHSHWA